jgi:hypothetical protein
MKKRNVNLVGIVFSLLIIAYCVVIAIEMKKYKTGIIIFPSVFLVICFVSVVATLLLYLTDWAFLKRVDGISMLKSFSLSENESTEKATDAVNECTKRKHYTELKVLFSFFLFFLMVYLFGFLPAISVYSFLFSFLSSQTVKRSIVTAFLLTVCGYLFYAVLPGGLWPGVFFG